MSFIIVMAKPNFQQPLLKSIYVKYQSFLSSTSIIGTFRQFNASLLNKST